MRSTNNLLNISSYHNPNQDLAASFKASQQSPRTPEKLHVHVPPAIVAEQVLNTSIVSYASEKVNDASEEDIDGQLTMQLNDSSAPIPVKETFIAVHPPHKYKDSIDLHPWGLELPKITQTQAKPAAVP